MDVAPHAYTDRMHSFRGCYHYESSESLDRGLEAAREYLADDELTEIDTRLFARVHARITDDDTREPHRDGRLHLRW